MPRPQYGQQFRQLPAATRRDLTPEVSLRQEIQTGRKQIQDRFTLQWNEINRSAQFVGRQKAANMRRQLHTKAKQEMLQFNQQAQQQLKQLQNIDQLAQQGAINKPEEIKARMTFGPDVAKSMYPAPEKGRSIPQQFGELDIYSERISGELENFQIIGAKKPSKLAAISPLATAISALRKKKARLQIWDPTMPVNVKGEDVMGDWRKAEPEEINRYRMLLQEEKAITQRKKELLGQPGISRRRVQPGTTGGTFDDKITESYKGPQRQSTSAELRKQGTREAYEEGKRLRYWR